MEKVLYTIEPFKFGVPWTIIISLAVAGVCFGFAFGYVQKLRLDYNRRQVLQLLLMFIGVTALFSGIWKSVSLMRLTPVRIYSNVIETPYGRMDFKNIADFYIKVEPKYRTMQQNVPVDTTKFFYLIDRSGKNHVLSEGDYPIDTILTKLNTVLDLQ
jgi:hypothetical protein